MKLKSVLAVFALATLTLGSCVKDYTCSCTYSTPSGNVTITPDSYKIHGNIKDATNACEGASTSSESGSKTCNIKL
ncbi:MAG: hypothetical protein ABI207_03850 [Crocinitomicaceae bacterium]